jgi:hypothetical protein
MNPAEPRLILALIERGELMLAEGCMMPQHRASLARALIEVKRLASTPAFIDIDQLMTHQDAYKLVELAQLVGPSFQSIKLRADTASSQRMRRIKAAKTGSDSLQRIIEKLYRPGMNLGSLWTRSIGNAWPLG